MQLTRLSLVVVCLVLGLTVPTAAVTLESDDAGPVTLEATSPYASTANGELELDFEKLNDRAVTAEDEAFTVTATDAALESVHLSHGVDGLTFYTGGDPDREIDAANPLALDPGETARVGVAVDTRVADSGSETFAVTARLDDEDEDADADVRLTNVSVSPTKLDAGENLTVRATYENRGEASGAATPELSVDGVVVDAQREWLVAGENATITFERTMADAGTFRVGVDGRETAVTVAEPDDPVADLVRTDAALERTTLEVGDPLVVSATYENRGEVAGDRTVELAVGGVVVDDESVALGPGETETVTFEWVPTAAGTYEVAVDGAWIGSATVGGSTPLAVAERVVGSPLAAAVAPPLAFGGLFVAAAANRRPDLWAPWWTADGE